jgi:GMP synthase-like glutamine amidotransferase
MHMHFVIHEPFEAPGAFETWASNRGHSTDYSRVYAQGALPMLVDGIDLLVVMGGPQSPSTTMAECPHFDAVAEKTLIAKAISAGKAVVGVCLGSQLIGEALGAPCEHSPLSRYLRLVGRRLRHDHDRLLIKVAERQTRPLEQSLQGFGWSEVTHRSPGSQGVDILRDIHDLKVALLGQLL